MRPVSFRGRLMEVKKKMILVNPDYDRKQKLGDFSRYVPLSVPIGIGYLAGYLESRGRNIEIVSLSNAYYKKRYLGARSYF